MASETTRLLPNSSQVKLKHKFCKSIFPIRWGSTCTCVSSPMLALILAWTFVNGAFYEGTSVTADAFIHGLDKAGVFVTSRVHVILGVYGVLAIATMLYPLGGFIADVWCGRYRVVICSLLIMWASLLLVFITGIPVKLAASNHVAKLVFQWIFGVLAFVLCMAALAGFTSNIVQLGFDQLLDKPSHSLGMFVHWYIWAETLGVTVVHTTKIVSDCTNLNRQKGFVSKLILYSMPGVFLLILSVLLVFSFCTRRYFYTEHFYTERMQSNPYKLIIKILNFARKNKYPVSPPSAFVYTYHRKPSRLDFAKKVFGGPFNNSDVDDVRTFIRVLVVLLALGPIFILQVPVSYTIFPQFAHHTGMKVYIPSDNLTCTVDWIILESGTLQFTIFIVLFPVYIWVVYSVLRNRIPKILIRISCSSVLFIIVVLSMLVTDLSGHLILNSEGDHNMTCMFLQRNFYYDKYEPLNLSWWVLILPNVLLSFAPHTLLATTLEFISAQGPHTMKGVLVGLLFAIKGFYQLVGASLVYLFTLNMWDQGVLKHISSIVSCEFGYLLITTLVALVGMVCFVVSACKYQYRVRGEEGFSQSDVEEVFERRLRLEQEYTERWEQNVRDRHHQVSIECEDYTVS